MQTFASDLDSSNQPGSITTSVSCLSAKNVGLVNLQDFNPANWQTPPLYKPGLYFFYKGTQCLYVGQSRNDVYKRSRKPCPVRLKALQGQRIDLVSFLPLDVDELAGRRLYLDIFEGWCIYLFRPTNNRLKLIYLDIFRIESFRKKRTEFSKKAFAIASGMCPTTYTTKPSYAIREKNTSSRQRRIHPPGCWGFDVACADRMANVLNVSTKELLYVPSDYLLPVFYLPVYKSLGLNGKSKPPQDLDFGIAKQGFGLEAKSVYFCLT